MTTLEKMYYMARAEPVDMVEGEDGVWRAVDVGGCEDATTDNRKRYFERMFSDLKGFVSYVNEFEWVITSAVFFQLLIIVL